MKARRIRRILCVTAIVAIAAVCAFPQQADLSRVLLIDETKTFLSTMRVAGLVGALRETGAVRVDVRLADVGSGFDDPLTGAEPPADLVPYPIAVVVTRGVDVGADAYIWILYGDLGDMSAQDRAAVALVSQVASQVFAGVGAVVSVYQDLFPALMWATYVQRGWMS